MRIKNRHTHQHNWVVLSRARHVAAYTIKKMEIIQYKKYFSFDYVKKLIFDPNYVALTCYLLLLAELLLNFFIVEYVRYTEIDWIAYMQEVEGFLNGTLDYKLLRGDTGPCVYPAGFLYVYSMFYYITDSGSNIKLAQYIFIGIYIVQSWLTYKIVMKTCKLPGYALVLSFATSYRIHSIYVLRLFNDPIAVLFFWASLNAFVSNRWKLGSFFFSVAVSIKMNILLYAPCLLLAYLANLNLRSVIVNLAICAGTQLFIGLPFLLTYPVSYLKGSFNLGRVFEHKWTVNYRFLDVKIFTNLWFHLGLLLIHLALLAVFSPLIWKYFKSYYTLRQTICDMRQESNKQAEKWANVSKTSKTKQMAKKKQQKTNTDVDDEPLTKEQQKFLDSFEKQIKAGNKQQSTVKQRNNKKAKQLQQQTEKPSNDDKYEVNFSRISQLFVLPFFVTNLIGIACARSLHYQFYSWYFHSLLYLAFSTSFSKPFAFLLLAVLESCWNIYPSTEWSSAALHVVHGLILYGVYKTMKV